MDAKIIFYTAKKTALCEKTLKRSFTEYGLKPLDSAFCTDAKSLGAHLTDAFNRCDTVFVVGGLGFSDRRNAADILASAAVRSPVQTLRRIHTDGDDGYLLRAGNQLLALLPDEPEQLEQAMRGGLSAYLQAYVNHQE